MTNQAHVSSAPTPSVLARSSQIAGAALLLGVPLALVETVLRLRAFALHRDVRASYLADAVELWIPIAALLVIGWVVVYHVARMRLGAGVCARLATISAFAYPAVVFGLRLNQEILPGAFEPASLAANAGLLFGGVLLGELAARRLRRWQETAWINKRSWGFGLVGFLLVPAGAHVVGHVPRRDPAPDVLVLLIDILRADHLGCYGYERPTSPNIDRFAEESILFENFISASTYTKTSIASLFTGLYAYNHGVYLGTFGKDPETVESDVLSDRFTTLAEALYDQGLNTVGWVQNGQVRAFMGYAQGFSLYHDQPGSIETIVTQFKDWHAEWAERSRYFGYLHFIDLHAPYQPEPPYRGRFGTGRSIAEEMNAGSWYDFKIKVARGEVVLTEQDIDDLEASHDEQLAYVDEWVGRVLDDLRASGRYDDTLIVLTSDHGEAFWEHEFISHSNKPFEELVHVPLIVKLPKSEGSGRRIRNMVGHVDLAPTLIEYVGGSPPRQMDGVSFLPLLNEPGTELEPRWRYIEFRGIVSVRTERWKYIAGPGGEPRLFDLIADPNETENCIADHPDVAEQLGAAVEIARERRSQAQKAERVVIDEETIESLKALGYL